MRKKSEKEKDLKYKLGQYKDKMIEKLKAEDKYNAFIDFVEFKRIFRHIMF